MARTDSRPSAVVTWRSRADRKSTRLNSSHPSISYAVFCLKKKQRDFRLLWSGMTLSALGDSLSLVALMWLVYQTSGSVRQLGWFVATYTAPVAVGGLIAGSVLDRFDRRAVLLADNLIRGAAFAIVPLLYHAGALALWHLYAVAA